VEGEEVESAGRRRRPRHRRREEEAGIAVVIGMRWIGVRGKQMNN